MKNLLRNFYDPNSAGGCGVAPFPSDRSLHMVVTGDRKDCIKVKILRMKVTEMFNEAITSAWQA